MKKKLIIITGALTALIVSFFAWMQKGDPNRPVSLTMENMEVLALNTGDEWWDIWQQGMRAAKIEMDQIGPDGKWHKVTLYCCVDATENDACNTTSSCAK